ncbi:MAG: glycosyltransferase [Candidatus Sulfotelmatobacter sp.]
MNFPRGLRIGYASCSNSLAAPGDRRRFCHYAAQRNLRFEIARPDEAYDIVVLTQAADISLWSRYPRTRGKIIFDFVDSYLAIPDHDPKALLRGIAKFATRQNRRLLLNYKRGLEAMCRRADAVVCSTESQRGQILSQCPNVHRILDFHSSVVRSIKSDYAAEEVFHFVWEGQPGNLRHLLEIKNALQDFERTRPFRIHAITDLEYGRFLGGRWIRRNTVEEARRISPQIYLYAWNERTFSAIACSCDLALIPIPLDDPLAAGKPENRLLLFWRMGVPVLASATAAHVSVMDESGMNMACTTRRQWLEALQYYTSNQAARKHAAQRGMAFVAERHSEKHTLELWDHVLGSVLSGEAANPREPIDSFSQVSTSPTGAHS